MELSIVHFLNFLIYFSSYFPSIFSDKILGCNGFIKSDVAIDFSKVEVKLISKEGNLKDRIECAPNNGYFFLPIYDKGDYALQISSIYKWAFEPREVKINFDGVNDPCSKGNDIIFNFKGFRVYGKVHSVGDRKGPKGVTITLVADLPTEQKEIHSVATDENGSFDISPVLPGSYIIKASHPRWRISKSLVTFVVEHSNYELPPKSLLFAGFDVTGSVVSNGEPITGVHFILFPNTDSAIESSWLLGCNTSPLEGFNVADIKLSNTNQFCYVTSDDKGVFLFPSVPSGNYVIVPFYKGMNSLKFDVLPRMVRFSVQHDSYVFSKPFQVSGFSIIGHIFTQPVNGKPIPGIKVILNKEKISETNQNGTFIFESVKSGSYVIQMKADDYQFSEQTIKITPNSAILDNIYPKAFRICGNVQKLQPLQVVVVFVASNGDEIRVEADEKGDYCQFLTLGNYTVNVVPTGVQPERVLWFFPVNLLLKVTDKPLKKVNFQQKTAELTGAVECMDDNVCGEISVILRGLDPLEEEYNEVTKGGKYKFTELYPGSYDLSVVNIGNWCWEVSTQRIEISDVYNEAPTFRRIGISFTVSSSHATKLKYKKLLSNETVSKEGFLDIKQGVQQYCLPGGAVYQLEPIGCHRYAEPVMRWEVGQDSLMLTALTHEVTAFIISSEIVQDLNVGIYTDHNVTLRTMIGPLKPTVDKRRANDHVYKFQFQAAHNEKLTIVPESSSLLFTPSLLTVRGSNDCTELEEHIVAKKGIRLQGSVQPPLENVKISILNELDEILISMFTDAEGKYKFMPLHSDHRYRVIGEKEGYLLSGPLENGVFKAHKLAEVQVKVTDDEDKPLQGVLLSLSGGDNYRQTSQSNARGEIIFLSLKPSEYYLRPLLKEYKFSPPSKVIKIKEGETVPVVFKGHRVLYSIFGSVSSLNRFAEKDVVIEAVSRAEEECIQHQEESTTDEIGQFRIRGLQPQCSYDIRLKQGSGINKQIREILPKDVRVKMNVTDVHGIELVAIPEPTLCDVSVFIEVESLEHMRTLQIKLKNDDGGILQSVKMSDWKLSRFSLRSILLPFQALPLNNKNYYVQLDSTLSKSTYSYLPQTRYFTTNTTFLLLKMTFKPDLKFSDGEVKHSYSAAIFIVILALMYWFRDSMLLALNQLQNNSRLSMSEFLNRYSQQPRGKENEKTFIEFEPGLTVVKRKIKPRKIYYSKSGIIIGKTCGCTSVELTGFSWRPDLEGKRPYVLLGSKFDFL